MNRFSPLELLHPNGAARTSFVLGNNCPKSLRPEEQSELDGNIELFILALSQEECRSKDVLEAAVKLMGQHLAGEGVGYILVPPRWRRIIQKLLRQTDLAMDASFWHFPSLSSSRYLVPVERNPARFTIDAILPMSPWKQVVARQVFQYAGTRWFMTTFWNSVGFTVRRPNARPLFHWLLEGEPPTSLPGTAIVRTSWREENGATLAYGFPRNKTGPAVVAKTVAAVNAAQPSREAQMLKALGASARRAGGQVPEAIARKENDRCSSLLTTFLPGRSVSDLLEANPGQFSSIMTKVVAWLENWQRGTAAVRPLQRDQLEQALLTPLESLSHLLDGKEMYRDWLEARSQVLAGNPAPLVATHNDLTMANVLLDERGRIGLVDWETGCPEGWPLVDFHYAITDAVRIAENCTTWLDAFKACYLPNGACSSQVAAWQERLQSALGLSAGFAELCFHACWLHHASNEHQVCHAGGARPFLDVVQWLALDEARFNHT